MSSLNTSDKVGNLQETDAKLGEAQTELEAWKVKVEKAEDVKARLILEKLDEDEKKKNMQQEMVACMKQQEDRQKDFSRSMTNVKDELQLLDKRRQALEAQLKTLQDALQARRDQSSRLEQKFKVCTQIPDTEINFLKQYEGSEVNDEVIAGVFTITQRVSVPLRGGQALITFEEEKVAAQVLKLAKCSMSIEGSSLAVTPVRISLDPAVKFEVHLDVSRKTVKVSNVPPSMPEDRVKDRLHISFSKPSRGGAEVEAVEYEKTTGTGSITFLHPGAAESLALRGKHQVDLNPEVSVKVAPEFGFKLRRFQTFCGSARRTVLLDNIPDVPDMEDEEDMQDHLEIYFQKPSNRGGEIESIKYLSGGNALRAFFCEDCVQAGSAP